MRVLEKQGLRSHPVLLSHSLSAHRQSFVVDLKEFNILPAQPNATLLNLTVNQSQGPSPSRGSIRTARTMKFFAILSVLACLIAAAQGEFFHRKVLTVLIVVDSSSHQHSRAGLWYGALCRPDAWQ